MKIFKMLSLVTTLSLGFLSVAHAEVAVNSISVENGIAKFVYQTGGGCGEHHAISKVVVTKSADGSRITSAQLVIDDSNPNDFCEALLYIEGTADLNALLKQAAGNLDIGGRTVIVKLPSVAVVAD